MKRALYLDGAAAPVGVFADGPALRICRQGRADVRAPLRLVSRIVVRGRVAWQTEALVACMEADVTVAFVTADGATRGWCVGARGDADGDITVVLDDCAARRDWRERHEDWVRAMERRALIRALPDGHARLEGVRVADVWAARATRLDRLRAPVDTEVILETLTGAMDAHVAELFRRAGVPARFVLGPGTPVHLLAGFRRVLIWELWPLAERSALYFCRHGVKRGGTREARRRLVRRYESAAPHIEKRFRELFWQLQVHLKGLLP